MRQLYKRIGGSIASARKKRGYSQEKLAAELRLTRTSITNIEQGRQHVQIHTLYVISASLDVPITELLPTRASLEKGKASEAISLSNAEWLERLNVTIASVRLKNEKDRIGKPRQSTS